MVLHFAPKPEAQMTSILSVTCRNQTVKETESLKFDEIGMISPLLMTCSVLLSIYSYMFLYIPIYSHVPCMCRGSVPPERLYPAQFSVEQLRPKSLEYCRAAANPGAIFRMGQG